ncbi:hypothetical protein [Methylomonas sp. AM2-LC]|uniref:hypothetical protein n=1 Tax=Methylomonas sp. AM2-LC TaxID=3153301 RepID=UPI0032670E24
MPGIISPTQVAFNARGDGKFNQTFAEWTRLMTKAEALGLSRFKFHQLKAKGVSDTFGDKQRASGHKTAAMVDVYDRKPAQVKPAGEE